MEWGKNARSIPLFAREASYILSQQISLVQPSMVLETPLLIQEPTKSSTVAVIRHPSNAARRCLSCRTTLLDREDQVEHYSSDWHRLNVKRTLRGRPPLSEDEFDLVSDELSSISGSGTELSEEEDGAREVGKGEERNSPLVQFSTLEGGCYAVYRCVVASASVKSVSVDMLAALSVPAIWVILMRAGGHFAGAVFNGVEILAHKTFHRYTVRAKRGSAQSARDSQQGGHQPRSAGASLRRYNESALIKEISELMVSWERFFVRANKVFVRVPHHLRHCFTAGKNNPLAIDDPRICKIPFTTRRPTFKEVTNVWSRLACVYLTSHYDIRRKTHSSGNDNEHDEKHEVGHDERREHKKEEREEEEKDQKGAMVLKEDLDSDAAADCLTTKSKGKRKDKTKERAKEVDVSVCTDPVERQLYESCEAGDVAELRRLLEFWKPNSSHEIKDGDAQERGKKYKSMFLLHTAASCGHADVITMLMEQGTDPSVRDSTGKLPFQLAKDKSTRNAFRRFMAQYPQKYNYQLAQIPSPLTEEMEVEQRGKKAAKKRAQKLAKQKRTKEKKEEEEEQTLQKNYEHKLATLSSREKRALAAEKRMASLLPSSSSVSRLGVCTWCGSCLCGLVPFERLDYKYCSIACVREHRADLAKAAGM